MVIPVVGPHKTLWHVYRNGQLLKVIPKRLFTRKALQALYEERYPTAVITVR